ncbi:MAG: aldolase/citrate lyase family protein [Cyanobacteriota bacterium]|nr:aldolase/citrate lyase family protein [Cyanobacteriota bacterium]
MNSTEKKLCELVSRIQSRGHLVSIKAEFEAEGTRNDELLRLLDIIHFHRVPLTLKIGGCEAVKDLFEARQFGARFIVAPMIESPYALQKFAETILKVYPEDEREEVRFLFNVETIQAYSLFDSLLAAALTKASIAGVVFGRTDFSGSLGIKSDVQHPQVTSAGVDMARKLASTDLDFVVGGAVSIASLPELKQFAAEKLSRFETRKVVFHSSSLADETLSDSLLDAVHFEILWLINKSQYYGALHLEDQARINQLESRWGVLGREL